MRFQPGQSGNPGGRPKEKPFREALRLELAAAGEDNKALRTIARALIDKAAEGDMAAIREVADRVDGKVAHAIVNDEESGPLQIIVRRFTDAAVDATE